MEDMGAKVWQILRAGHQTAGQWKAEQTIQKKSPLKGWR
jgi:hypothetical protein